MGGQAACGPPLLCAGVLISLQAHSMCEQQDKPSGTYDMMDLRSKPNRRAQGIINKANSSPGWVAQWIEHQPTNQRVASSIPIQGTCLGCRPGPQ